MNKYGIRKILNKLYMVVSFGMLALSGCGELPVEDQPTLHKPYVQPTASLPDTSPSPQVNVTSTQKMSSLNQYEFPVTVDLQKWYMFYLHGKIIEDQGLPAISPDYGEYEYIEILRALSQYNFVVISEQRAKNTNVESYARKIVREIKILLDSGVPAQNITVVGASKGAAIAVLVSHFLENHEVNFPFFPFS